MKIANQKLEKIKPNPKLVFIIKLQEVTLKGTSKK